MEQNGGMEQDNVRRCELPYAAAYANKSRIFCYRCTSIFEIDQLVLAQREVDRSGDITEKWMHKDCFWALMNPHKYKISETVVHGLEWLKWEDQESIRASIRTYNSPSFHILVGGVISRFAACKIDISITSRGKCSICMGNFKVKELKVGRSGKWNHVECFFTNGKQGFGDTPDKIHGFKELCEQKYRDEFIHLIDEITVKKALEKVTVAIPRQQSKNDEIMIISRTPTPTPPPPSSSYENQILTSRRQTPELVTIPSGQSNKRTLEDEKEEDQDVSPQKKARMELLRKKQEEREAKQFQEQADMQWELMQFFKKNLKTDKVILLLKEANQEVPPGHDKQLERLVDCVMFGPPCKCPVCETGNIVYSSAHHIYVCCGYVSEYTKCTYTAKNPLRSSFGFPQWLMKMPEFNEIATTKLGFFTKRLYAKDDCLTDGTNIAQDPQTAFPKFNLITHFETGKRIESVSKQIVKNGTVVDAAFPLANICHVYSQNKGVSKVLFHAALAMIDVSTNRNSYCKIQLLKEDHADVFYVFTISGRVGTVLADTQSTSHYVAEEAIREFEDQFEERTGNKWKYRKYFKKLPGKMELVETDFSEFENVETPSTPGTKSKLVPKLQEIMKMIFNTDDMKKQLQTFSLDLEKMPLGKLSHSQLLKAYTVLSELEDILTADVVEKYKVLDITNKFYSIIPHNFGVKEMQLLDSLKLLKEKTKMVDSLVDIQLAYGMKKKGKEAEAKGMDIIDSHFLSLGCHMEVLESNHSDYKMIENYMMGTIGKSHDVGYKLLDVIAVSRGGESVKFKKDLGNRMLLWHGSGITNYAGILSQGLRIAPPEAPATGYMFGKGVYFADMFTKSSFYCKVDRGDAFLLLCDVALGQSRNELNAYSHTSKTVLPHHSVKGVGREYPEPSMFFRHPDGFLVPQGHLKQRSKDQVGTLLYNEYIVYNTNQICLKYLVRVRFNHARYR